LWQYLVHRFSDLIQFCYHLTGLAGIANYGLAIILMTIFIKIVLFPLTNMQFKSMLAMQGIQPKMKEIQARYKDTPEKMQAETMKLYKEHGVNPLGGCLPLLIQLPILMAFYSALQKFKYVIPAHAVFLWLPNLSSPDKTFILAILAGLTTYLQQKISTVDTKDPTQRSMLIVMPIFIAWMATRFAAGLALYWVVFNILSILQQLYVNKRNRPKLPLQPVMEAQVETAGEAADEIGKGGTADADNRKKRKKRG
jgi:YidC/Oxa1 family membrane protein insertase